MRVAGRWMTVGLQLGIEDYVLQAVMTMEAMCTTVVRCSGIGLMGLMGLMGMTAVGLSLGPGLVCWMQWRMVVEVK